MDTLMFVLLNFIQLLTKQLCITQPVNLKY